MKINRFEELDIWKVSIQLTKQIYLITSSPKFSKDLILVSQIRRAVISISSNIVEGFEKRNNTEFCRFLKIAKGSTGEIRSQLYIAFILDYIAQTDYSVLASDLEKLSGQIGAFISYLTKLKSTNQFIKK